MRLDLEGAGKRGHARADTPPTYRVQADVYTLRFLRRTRRLHLRTVRQGSDGLSVLHLFERTREAPAFLEDLDFSGSHRRRIFSRPISLSLRAPFESPSR